jgi:DNA-binding response OmpR family regulator
VTTIPILIVTGDFTTEKETAALDSGADLYARWHNDPDGNISSVIAHINRISERSRTPIPPPNIMIYRQLLISPEQPSVFIGNTKIVLTPKEFGVLYLLVANKGRVFSPEQIYEKIWGKQDENIKEVIWTTIKRLRQKLQTEPHSPDYIKTVREVGYSFDPN